MTYLRTDKWPNHDYFTYFHVYQCDGCDTELPDNHPRVNKERDDIHFCLECGFRLKLVGSDEYAKAHGCGLGSAYIDQEGDIVLNLFSKRRTKKKNPLKRRSLDKTKRFAILHRDNFTCKYCGATPETTELRVDHKKPVSKGGSDDESNLITACFDCNSGKSDIEYKNIEDR